ncbi:histidine protein methyltransferase 1 homolog isoform X2 [Salvelinus sp. IW2-2015]|uniref:histidine protein methyltransferase 1 homolog isoform X2 n=1 Tax=Salvelinus sp. IW2-2015 TaxID=2691554 RepID=UPI000CDF5DED|nr:histidine protein methyltransferase 1 homolog isoform X2 [Salvelinus alpinus]
MSFSFNFDVQLTTKGQQGEESKPQTGKQDYAVKPVPGNNTTTPAETVKAAVEHHPPADPHFLLNDAVSETVTIGTLPPLHFLNESVFERTASERDDNERILSRTAAQSSDLISGVYEGGLKVWECTYDLLELLEREGETFGGKMVLDLGCGAGLLGLLALKSGASQVHFQDYNSTVIEQLTLPNALLNCQVEGEEEEEEEVKGRKGKKRGLQEEDDETIIEEDEMKKDEEAKSDEEKKNEQKKEGEDGSPSPKRQALDPSQHTKLTCCRFFSGDWTTFLALVLKEDLFPKYDIIFTSETIYNTAYYSALHDTLHRLLAPRGVVYLATKAHYFGVGGGLHLFEQFIEDKGVFDMEKLWDVDQGLQRHVVAMHFKTPIKS